MQGVLTNAKRINLFLPVNDIQLNNVRKQNISSIQTRECWPRSPVHMGSRFSHTTATSFPGSSLYVSDFENEVGTVQLYLPPPQAFLILFSLRKERLGDWERTKGRERELVARGVRAQGAMGRRKRERKVASRFLSSSWFPAPLLTS